MSGKCKLITFGKIDKYFLLIFAAVIIRVVAERFVEFKYTDKDSNKTTKMDNIITIFVYSLGLSLSIFLFLIHKILNKKNKGMTKSLTFNQNNNNNHISSNKEKRIIAFKKFLWILLISVVDCVSTSVNFYFFYASIEITFVNIIINAIIMNFYYFWIFKIKLYKHHYLSIIIFCVLAILMFIIDFIVEVFQDSTISYGEYLSETFYLFLEFALTFFSFVIEKYFMVKTYVRLYENIFIQGLIELILSSSSIAILIHCNVLKDFSFYWNIFLEEETRIILLTFIFCVYYSILFLVIDIFSPFHVILIYLFEGIVYLIYNIFFLLQNKIYIVYSFFILICLFFIGIYIEIIELNFWGLSYNTKKNIELRAQIEQNINNNDDISEDESNEGISHGGYIFKLENDTNLELNSINYHSIQG